LNQFKDTDMVSAPHSLVSTGVASAISNLLPSSTSNIIAGPMAVLSIRGGQAFEEEGLDIARASFRLEGIDTYSIVAALLLQAALKLYSDFPKDLETTVDKKEKLKKILFILSAIISMLCSAYTTVVFSLLCLYSKSALGFGQDKSFLDFFAATALVRKRAFDSLIVALLSFEVCFITSLSINYDGRLRWWSVIMATIIAIMSWMHWQTIILLASRLLFGD
jgi:hypothetical protein